MTPQDQSGIAVILDRFKMGAHMDEEATVYNDQKIGVEGLKLIRQSLKELDARGPHGRDVLIPLLSDPEPSSRVWAAAALINVIPERALAVLHEIRDFSFSDACMTAGNLLILHGQGRLNY
jgi:hypothetical protein